MKKDFLTRPWAVALLACICCVLWGSAVATIKTGYRLMDIDSADTAAIILFAGLRFALAGILVAGFACMRKKRVILPTKTVLKYAFPLCLAQTVGQYVFFYVGVAHASGVKSSIFTGLGNFIAILMSCLIFRKERMTGSKLAGCILGFAGVLVINLTGSSLDFGISLAGEGALFVSQIAYALSTVLIREFSKEESPMTLSGYQFFIGGVIMIVIGLLTGGRLRQCQAAALLILLYLALLSALAYTLWSVLLAHNPVSSVAVYGFVNPLCGVILSALVLGEAGQILNVGSMAALALVCAGIYVVNRRLTTP